jgi:hypothetical protein
VPVSCLVGGLVPVVTQDCILASALISSLT